MANVKFVAVSRGLSGIVDYVTNREKTTDKLIIGVNCVAKTAVHEFEAVKKQFHKTDGRAYYHIVQAFAPDDPVDFETVHQIGLEFAAHFKGYQCLVATHMNTKHKHNHIIMNSVNFETGMKFHQSAKEMRMVKEFNNELCRKYGLSVTEAKADPFHVPKWKDELKSAIRQAMECSNTREEFMAEMESMGYGVKWGPNQKYITYTTPDNIRCRDNKLFDQTLLRGNMELYFAMGDAANGSRHGTKSTPNLICGSPHRNGTRTTFSITSYQRLAKSSWQSCKAVTSRSCTTISVTMAESTQRKRLASD